MERTARTFLLTPLCLAAVRAQAPAELAVREVVPVRAGAPARLCPGDNALRVTLAWSGAAPPPRAAIATLRLALVLPGGPPAGTLIAEGSAPMPATGATTTFTFLHVEVAERLRGRGAQLVVRVTNGVGGVERERGVSVDAVADWGCRRD
ncbi:hypothetical protein J421_1215 [Gemmatirosa kalamazoonensis]|uniref:Uncharacterized protein n=1 Tax=Gemmatirosa kalamazoonensis TaxID=861299 RepID=W0RE97_9BACT|nr:hypothetical protein [Gemmatirosa kalamazoonensis]AHG88752.1 hypothetical protein J421_1215 [Gemmatirosa kalamazoonensis]